MEGDELPELKGSVTVGVITVTQLDWWNEHPDAFSEAEAVLGWEELHVDRRTVGPVIEDRPEQRLTMTVEEAAVMLGISRATAYDAVSRGEIPCLRIGRRILIPKVAMEKLLNSGSSCRSPSCRVSRPCG
jgi:excisionase family DNA binding protein